MGSFWLRTQLTTFVFAGRDFDGHGRSFGYKQRACDCWARQFPERFIIRLYRVVHIFSNNFHVSDRRAFQVDRSVHYDDICIRGSIPCQYTPGDTIVFSWLDAHFYWVRIVGEMCSRTRCLSNTTLLPIATICYMNGCSKFGTKSFSQSTRSSGQHSLRSRLLEWTQVLLLAC